MKKPYSAALSAAALAAAFAVAPARADTIGFTGPFAPANWTLVDTGNVSAGSMPFFTPTTLTITGQDDTNAPSPACTGFPTAGATGPCTIGESIAVTGPTTFTFQWSYTTQDLGPQFDFFDAIVDGVVVPLSDLGSGLLSASGTSTLTANDSLAFIVDCQDCTGGAMTGVITSFAAAAAAAAVPEPEVVALLGVGLLAVGVARRRRFAPRSSFAAA
jgi:PEP-CTERM motif